MASNQSASPPVKTTRRSFEILEQLVDQNGATLAELSDALGMVKSTVHRHIHTLLDIGYVIKEDEEYHVAAKSLAFGDHAQHRKRGYVLAEEKTSELAEATEERAQFIIEEHGRGVYVFVSHGEKAVKNKPRLGRTFPLHAAAAGKVIMASHPREYVQQILERHGLREFTDMTITDEASLWEELDRVREMGHGFNIGEHISGLNAVAVAIEEPNGDILGTLSISGPSERLMGEYLEEELPQLLKGSANEIELNLQHLL